MSDTFLKYNVLEIQGISAFSVELPLPSCAFNTVKKCYIYKKKKVFHFTLVTCHLRQNKLDKLGILEVCLVT